MKKLSVPPLFVLPPASTGHARHFMPWFKKGPTDRTLVFDAFVAVEKRNDLIILWPDAFPDDAERKALVRIADVLGFLGRAESWTEARVLETDEAQEALQKVNSYPENAKGDTLSAKTGMDPVRLLCADPDTAFLSDHTPKPKKAKGRGRGREKQETVASFYDPDWHLCMETLELHSARWSDPPGARWVTYMRLKDCFKTGIKAHKAMNTRPRPTVARFAIDGPVLPLVEDTLKIGELARRTAMGIFRRIEEQRLCRGAVAEGSPLPHSDVFSGKDRDGRPLKGHKHAYFLPTDEDDDGRIDHLTIIAEMGFNPQEVKTLDRMSRLKRDEGEALNLVLLGIGRKGALHGPKIFGPSRVWISETPFIATRHQKARGTKKDPPELLGADNQKAFAKQVLLEEITRLRDLMPDLPMSETVEFLNDEHCMAAHKLRPIQFKRFRQKRSDDGGRRPAGAFRIVFPEPVSGPICLGHSCHFGMGFFIPGD